GPRGGGRAGGAGRGGGRRGGGAPTRLGEGASRREKPSLLLSDYVLRSIITGDARCRFDVSRGLAEFIYQSALTRGSWWSIYYTFLREMYSGVTFGKLLLALLLISAGSVGLFAAMIGLEQLLTSKDVSQDNPNLVPALAFLIPFLSPPT